MTTPLLSEYSSLIFYGTLKFYAMEKERCNCGCTEVKFYPDENHYEPVCWDCYYQEQERIDDLIRAHEEKGDS